MLLFKKKQTQEEKEETSVPVIPHDFFGENQLSLKDVIAPAALQVNPNFINIGGKYARTFFVISYPRQLAKNWFNPIINLDRVFDISIYVHPIDTSVVLRQLQKKVAEVQSQISVREERGMVRDPKLDTAYQDIEFLRDQLQQSREKMFDVGLYLTFYGDSEEELNKTESEVKNMLESKLVYVKPTVFQQ